MACDYAINPLLLDAGLTLPKDVLIEHRFRGMSAERIYNLIAEQENQGDSDEEMQDQDDSADGGEESSCNVGDEDDTPVRHKHREALGRFWTLLR